MFTTQFREFVCVGDTVQCIVDGVMYTATVHHDADSHPSDFDCYSAHQIARFDNEEWFFCGIVLSAEDDNGWTNDHIDSLWGVECNIANDNSYLLDVANELLADALTTA